ncbi:MAG: cobalt-precorrin-6A reductase [Cyanobacteria bacterium J06621_3]
MCGRIWLIGGTCESSELAYRLSARAVPYVVTVTTDAARALYPQAAQVHVGQLADAAARQFVRRWQIRGILDASHPFASEVSRLAIALAQTEAIAYLRYERTDMSPDANIASASPTDSSQVIPSQVIQIDAIQDLVTSDTLQQSSLARVSSVQRILFTIGYRALPTVRPLRQTAQLFARVLPSAEAVSGAIAAGFSSQEIMAIRPPVSAELEAALWRQWKITHIVAKASGAAGGEGVKRAIAAELGVVLILIRRPRLIYPNQTNSISAATEFCVKTLRVY